MLFEFEDCGKHRHQNAHSPLSFKARPTDAVHIPLKKCVTNFWFKFGNLGDHPIQKQVRQLLEHKGEMGVQDTVLYQHYQSFQPKTYREAAEIRTDSPLMLPMAQHSSGKYLPIQLRTVANEEAWIAALSNASDIPDWDQNIVGPQTQEKILSELKRITSIIQSIARDGYSPNLYKDGFVRGVFIEMGQDWKFLVTAGMHRLAVMSNLGYADFLAKLQPGWPPVLDVSNPSLPRDLREYLRLFFKEEKSS
jgi:hypothetical protein